MGMGNGQGGVIDAQQSAPRPAQFPFALDNNDDLQRQRRRR